MVDKTGGRDGRSDPQRPRYAKPYRLGDSIGGRSLLVGIGLMVRAIDGERGLERLPALLETKVV